jgi:hypothetical protein
MGCFYPLVWVTLPKTPPSFEREWGFVGEGEGEKRWEEERGEPRRKGYRDKVL